MNKLYKRIDFVNDTTPALNDSNLNLMSKALDDIDDRVIEVSDDIMVVVPQIQEMLQSAETLVTEAEASANSASISADEAEQYAQEAAAGSGGDNLNYEDEMLQLKRGDRVLSAVHIAGGGGGGTSDYNDLTNKPSINNVELSGNKTAEALGLAESSKIYGSEPFNISRSYVPGDTCTDGNALYSCLIECVGVDPATDDGTYWEKVTLADLESKKSDKFEFVTILYTNASAVSLAANKGQNIALSTTSNVSNVRILGLNSINTQSGNLSFSTLATNTVYVRNQSSSTVSISAGQIQAWYSGVRFL